MLAEKFFKRCQSENVNRHVKKLTNKNLRSVVLGKRYLLTEFNEKAKINIL